MLKRDWGLSEVILIAKETQHYKSHEMLLFTWLHCPPPLCFFLGRGHQQLYHPAANWSVTAQCNTATDEWCDAQRSPAIRSYCQSFCFINGNTASSDSRYKRIHGPSGELQSGYLCCGSGCVFLWSVSPMLVPYCLLCVLVTGPEHVFKEYSTVTGEPVLSFEKNESFYVLFFDWR